MIFNFLNEFRARRARRRLERLLKDATIHDLRMSSALQDFFNSNHLLPGDVIKFTMKSFGNLDLKVDSAGSEEMSNIKQITDL